MPLPNLKKTAAVGQCAAMRCTDKGEELPGDLWGASVVVLCARHLGMALEYAERNPEAVPGEAIKRQTEIAFPESSSLTEQHALGAKHVGMGNVDGVLGWLTAVKSAVDGIGVNNAEAQSVLDLAKAFEINTHDDMVLVAEWTQESAKSLKELERSEKEISSPISTALSRIRSIFRPTKQLWVDAQVLLRAQLAAARLREEDNNRRVMEEAASAHAAGDDRADLSGLTVSTDLEGVSMKVLWKAVVDDVMLLPLEYVIRIPDAKKLKEYCAAAEAAGAEPEPIAGVRFERDVAMRVQSR